MKRFARAKSVCACRKHTEQVKKEGFLAGTVGRAIVSRPTLLDVVVSPEVRPSNANTGKDTDYEQLRSVRRESILPVSFAPLRTLDAMANQDMRKVFST